MTKKKTTTTIKTVDGYYGLISNNLNNSGRYHYYGCRDLYDAKVNLITKVKQNGREYLQSGKYLELVEKLDISRTTVEKYLAIGSSKRLADLEKKGTLPQAWTTQYHLTTLTDKQWENLQSDDEELTTSTSIAKINRMAMKVGKKAAKQTHLLFLKLNIVKGVTTDTYEMCQRRITNMLTTDRDVSEFITFDFDQSTPDKIAEQEKKEFDKDLKRIKAANNKKKKWGLPADPESLENKLTGNDPYHFITGTNVVNA
jgi:hypothetical protein